MQHSNKVKIALKNLNAFMTTETRFYHKDDKYLSPHLAVPKAGSMIGRKRKSVPVGPCQKSIVDSERIDIMDYP
jgi:hypothetical protein